MVIIREIAGSIPEQNSEATARTDISSYITGSFEKVGFLSMSPDTGSYLTWDISCDIFGNCTVIGSGTVNYTNTHTLYTYDCDCNTLFSQTVTNSPFNEQQTYQNTIELDGFTKKEFLTQVRGNNATTNYNVTEKYYYSSRNNMSFSSNDPIESLTNYSYSRSWKGNFQTIVNGSNVSYVTDASLTYNYNTLTCCDQSITGIEDLSETHSTITATSDLENQRYGSLKVFGIGTFDTITDIDFYSTQTNANILLAPYIYETYLDNVAYFYDKVSTSYENSLFSSFNSTGHSGQLTYFDAVPGGEKISLGLYYDSLYYVEDCAMVSTASYYKNYGETSVWSDVFHLASNNSFRKDGVLPHIAKHIISESTESEGRSEYITRVFNSHVEEYNVFAPNLFIPNDPSMTFKDIMANFNVFYKPVEKLTEDATNNLYTGYSVKVASTLNSGKYSREYNLRHSGIIGSVVAGINTIYEVNTINPNDIISMLGSVEVTQINNDYTSYIGGYNYFYIDDITELNFGDGAFSYTSKPANLDQTEGSFAGSSTISVRRGDYFTYEKICAVVIGSFGESTDEDAAIPANPRESPITYITSLCSNQNSFESSNFAREQATFNEMNFHYTDRITEQTLYYDTPGFIQGA